MTQAVAILFLVEQAATECGWDLTSLVWQEGVWTATLRRPEPPVLYEYQDESYASPRSSGATVAGDTLPQLIERIQTMPDLKGVRA